MKRVALLALVLLGALSGCATLLRPLVPARRLAVASTPEGAAVLLDGWVVGRTPCTIEVPHASDGVVALQLDGYEPHLVVLPKRGFWPIFLDLIPVFGYLVAVAVVHNDDTDSTWDDDWLKAAGFTLVPAAAAVLVDVGTGSHRIFPAQLPSIQVTLIKRDR